jgi:hypothetical protein
MLDRVKEIFEGIPKFALVVVGILVLLGAVWAWKRFTRVDKESEVTKGVDNALMYAQNIQQKLDSESTPLNTATTPEYAATVQKGLEDFEKETAVAADAHDDDDDFEPFDE